MNNQKHIRNRISSGRLMPTMLKMVDELADGYNIRDIELLFYQDTKQL